MNFSEFFSSINTFGSVILWAVPSDEFIHPCVTDISAVFIKNINTKETFYLSFNHPDLLPVIDKKTFINNLNILENKKWIFDKKSFLQLLPNTKNLLDINLFSHLKNGTLIDKQILETQAHKFIYRTKKDCGDLNNTIPLLKHKEMFEKICQEFLSKNNIDIIDDGYKKENEIVIETLAEIEKNGVYIDNKLNYTQYNFYTSTGRPSNHFNGINYAALNKEDGTRDKFVSRYGSDGVMVLVDYSAFHPRIICHLTGFKMDINQDIYKYLGEMYYHRKIVGEYDIEEIKKITMKQLYGGIENQYENIKYFGNLKEFINNNWDFFKKNGYVLTPIFKRYITKDHLKDANPNKLFNYILQATETEISLSAIQQVNKYLKDKKTKLCLYTYDSALFDFHKNDGMKIFTDIVNIMMMGNRFPVKIYVGISYGNLKQIYP